ncbi:hypothetical protein [Flavicella sediminum]|uniref:hypothetical protein n=1 Tax=Flavicella sediminum TaxID=2585141 RepID=UPI0011209C4B|nr:hypothetical protein [Flavicella sediminum]
MGKKLIWKLLALMFVFAGCAPEKKTQINEHLNIIITPDLSNRITEGMYPKPVKDEQLIESLYKNYYPEFYKINNRVIGQKDKIQVVLTNPSILKESHISLSNFSMDLSKFNPSECIKYLTHGENEEDLARTTIEIQKLYNYAQNNTTGGDVYNYLKKELNSSLVKGAAKPLQLDANTTVINKYRNIIVLLTDGYIEAGLYGKSNCKGKQCLYLTSKIIADFRKEYLKANTTNLQEFFNKSGYGILPVVNKNLKNCEVLVVEMYDRTLNQKTGSQTVSPNDFEIMKLFWADWLKKSGVQHFKLLDVSTSEAEFLSNLKNFIKEPAK